MLLSAFGIVVLVLALIVTIVAVEWFRRPTYHASACIQIIADDEGKKEEQRGLSSN